jgi:hypothetical protein
LGCKKRRRLHEGRDSIARCKLSSAAENTAAKPLTVNSLTMHRRLPVGRLHLEARRRLARALLGSSGAGLKARRGIR